MITTLIRTIVLYAFVLLSVRLMGKKELASMDAFQFVTVFMIGELASLPIESSDTSLVDGVIAILSIFFLSSVTSYFALKSEIFKRIVSGKPSVLIEDGKICDKSFKKANISITDFMEQLRIKDCSSIADVSYALLETNGEISIVLKPSKRPPTCEDMSITKEKESMPCILISDGNWYKNNIMNLGFDEETVRNTLLDHGITDSKNVFLCFSDESKTLHVYPKSDLESKWR